MIKMTTTTTEEKLLDKLRDAWVKTQIYENALLTYNWNGDTATVLDIDDTWGWTAKVKVRHENGESEKFWVGFSFNCDSDNPDDWKYEYCYRLC